MTTGPSSEQTSDLLQKLSLDSQPKNLEIIEPAKKLSGNQYGTIDSKDNMNGQTQAPDRSMTPMSQDFVDPSMCYPLSGYPPPAYYFGEWDDYARSSTPDGLEMSSGVYDNASMMYQNAYGYGHYLPYSPSSQVPSMGHDGQLYGPQQYQYPPYFQPSYPASPAIPAQGDVATSAAPDQKSLSVESTNGNSNGIVSGGGVKGNNVKSTYQKPSYYNSNGAYGKGGSYAGGYSGYQDARYNYDALRSPMSWSDGTTNSLMPSISKANNLPYSRNQNLLPYSTPYMGLQQPRPTSGMGTAQGYTNRLYPNKLYNQYDNTVRSGFGYGSNGYDYRVNGRGWYPVDNKFRTRGRGFGYGNENMDGLNELNRGPRAKGAKNQKDIVPPTTETFQGQNETNEEKDKSCVIPDRELYNLPDFPVDYENAKFFIIKSYSEDDVHKSIKYNVWASTPNGNKKLDAAYQEKFGADPIFLFFSVNTSGQFVGLAEMIGPVDFNKNLEYWQQDKWMGCFSLKWHIVKDLPNSLLKHIILENNENKPVTNSRDTQEVKLEQGLQMLKIFKEHSCKTCILDDFGFYEARQNTIQEKKAKLQLIQKQVWEGKLANDKNKEGELKVQKSPVVSSDLTSKDTASPVVSSDLTSKDTASPDLTNGDVKLSENIDSTKGTKPVEVLESKIVANGC